MQNSEIMINVLGMHFARKGKKKTCNQANSNENYTME